MKKQVKFFVVLLLIAFIAPTFAACAHSDKDVRPDYIALTSVGNGDGTVSFIAENISKSKIELDVTINIYKADEYDADKYEEEKTLIAGGGTSVSIKYGEKHTVTTSTDGDGYFSAVAIYITRTFVSYIECDPVHYDAQGNRVTETDGVKYEVRKA